MFFDDSIAITEVFGGPDRDGKYNSLEFFGRMRTHN